MISDLSSHLRNGWCRSSLALRPRARTSGWPCRPCTAKRPWCSTMQQRLAATRLPWLPCSPWTITGCLCCRGWLRDIACRPRQAGRSRGRAHLDDMHHAVRLVIGRHRATKGEAVRIARGAHRVDGLEARLKERRVRAVVRVDEVPNACAAYRALGVYSDAVAQIIAVDRVWIVWLRAWVSDARRASACSVRWMAATCQLMAVQCAREASVAHNDALLIILRHRNPSKQNQGDEAVHPPGEYAALLRRPRGERRLDGEWRRVRLRSPCRASREDAPAGTFGGRH